MQSIARLVHFHSVDILLVVVHYFVSVSIRDRVGLLSHNQRARIWLIPLVHSAWQWLAHFPKWLVRSMTCLRQYCSRDLLALGSTAIDVWLNFRVLRDGVESCFSLDLYVSFQLIPSGREYERCQCQRLKNEQRKEPPWNPNPSGYFMYELLYPCGQTITATLNNSHLPIPSSFHLP